MFIVRNVQIFLLFIIKMHIFCCVQVYRLWRLWRLWRPHVSAVEATCFSCLCCTCQWNKVKENTNKISFIKYMRHCWQLNTNCRVIIYEQKLCLLPWSMRMFSNKFVGFVTGRPRLWGTSQMPFLIWLRNIITLSIISCQEIIQLLSVLPVSQSYEKLPRPLQRMSSPRESCHCQNMTSWKEVGAQDQTQMVTVVAGVRSGGKMAENMPTTWRLIPTLAAL